jgi:hypothetical protein
MHALTFPDNRLRGVVAAALTECNLFEFESIVGLQPRRVLAESVVDPLRHAGTGCDETKEHGYRVTKVT